ncbi:hypothetical protein DP939_33755 [Spongiactinospora rosea]|uniref:Uncharacterized protein n=1 Tax=Spongiactinospora rosea TaxID=2248750 RepID=A0A366LP09_9ACTN|nr:hypothetical protein [Spongiactinospora rosea]RBQ15658.1 hypothetical protein DP939_33755 [Spongiactinospora rosea]
MLKVARAVMFLVIPGELLLFVLLVAGVRLPTPVLVAAEVAAALALAFEVTTFGRLYRAERRRGAAPRAALAGAFATLVPVQVRRLLLIELRGMAGLGLWLARRRHGVPRGGVAVLYAREQATMTLIMLLAMVIETVALDVLLTAMDVPTGLRIAVLVLDVYGILYGLMFAAACATRPHVITPTELRIRYGVYFDLRIPRELITSVRSSRNLNEKGMIGLADGRLGVAVSSQTNITVELAEPVTITRPLGAQAEARVIRFFADHPATALRALRTTEHEALT